MVGDLQADYATWLEACEHGLHPVEDVQHERSGGRHVGRNERDAGLHQPGDEVDIAGQPVELGDQQGRPMTSEHASMLSLVIG